MNLNTSLLQDLKKTGARFILMKDGVCTFPTTGYADAVCADLCTTAEETRDAIQMFKCYCGLWIGDSVVFVTCSIWSDRRSEVVTAAKLFNSDHIFNCATWQWEEV